MANTDVNQAAEDLNRAAIHVQDELNKRMARLKDIKGEKDSTEAVSTMKSLTKHLEKAYDDLQDFVPTEQERSATKSTKEEK
ncbi:MAG: hypothetical protein UMS36scaffold28_8 [Phage 59_13]|nr:MAG: hypothetical protein UMS36scaffold28_8 [Phage 59_13]